MGDINFYLKKKGVSLYNGEKMISTKERAI